MEWIISNKRFDMTDLMISIEFTPKNNPLRYFLSGVNLIKYPKLLDSTYKQNSYYQSPMSLRFYKELDWEDLQELEEIGGIKNNEVVIYHEVYGQTTVKESIFIQILLDYSLKLLEVYKNDLNISKAWLKDMEEGIYNLKTRLES
jgi:hypothetical protein